MTNIINNAGSRCSLQRVAETLMWASPWLHCRNFLSAQLWRNTFLKSREVRGLRKSLTFTREKTLMGLQSGCCDSVIQHCSDFFYHANSKSRPATQLFSYVLCSISRVSSCRCVGNNVMLLTNAFKGRFIIPNFTDFTQQIDKMYDSAYQQQAGQVSPPHTHTHTLFSAAVSITLRCLHGLVGGWFHPSAGKVQPWAVGCFSVHSGWTEVRLRLQREAAAAEISVLVLFKSCSLILTLFPRCILTSCRHSAGDTKVPFCLQSCVKPLAYAVALHNLGTERTHQFVGKEPSGFRFNKLSLNDEGASKVFLRPARSPHSPGKEQDCWLQYYLLLLCVPLWNIIFSLAGLFLLWSGAK